MRKAKSLLALVLAMLTLLAFLPTALADETAHAVKLTHGEHVSLKAEAPTTTTPGQNLVIEYKSDHADFVPDKPTVTIGENSYQVVTSNPDLVGMSAPFSLSSAPVMTNGKTYVPIELFVPLTGNDSSIIKTDGSAISISKKADTKNEDVQIPNPLTEHETLADLAKTVGFDVTLPTLDKAYKETAFIDISGTIADVRFADDEDTITFRKAKGSDDISGDNKTYKENKTIAVKDVSVSVKGNDGINTATWQKDGFTYSFSSDKAMTQDALVKAIENLF